MIRVRDTVGSDAEAWRAIIREAASEPRPGIITRPDEIWSAEAFVAKLADAKPDESAFLAAEIDGDVVGVLGLARGTRLANRHTAEFGITVARAARGRGVGTALIRAAEERARAWGVRKVTLGVLAENEAARRLYRRLGYEEEGLRREQFLMPQGLMDEVLMAKWVG